MVDFYKNHTKDIKKLKNIHKEEDVFILASGPSIKSMDLSKLKYKNIIGVNGSFHIKKDYNLNFNYYVISDLGFVWKKHWKSILSLDTKLFVGGNVAEEYFNNIHKYLSYTKGEVYSIKSNENIYKNNTWTNQDITKGTPTCRHIPASMAIPLSYYLGFKNTYLIGVDCDYSMKDNYFYGSRIPTKEMLEESYFEKSFLDYKILYKTFKENNREIYNATNGGKLEIYPRVNLKEVLNE